MAKWRVGRKLGRTIYLADECVGMMDTPAFAAYVVDAVNEVERLRGQVARLKEVAAEMYHNGNHDIGEIIDAALAEPEGGK